MPELQVEQISVDDERLVPNSLCRRVNGRIGLKTSTQSVVPDTYNPEAKFASATLLGIDAVKFLTLGQFVSMTKVNAASSDIPSAGQRVPTSARKKGIREAWNDPSRTPDYRVETIELALFNGTVSTNEGIQLNSGSILNVNDGLGRLQAAIDELNEILDNGGKLSQHTWAVRNFLIQLNFDLSGDRKRGYNSFLLMNRDAKRVTKGTVLLTEKAVLEEMPEDASFDYDNPLCFAWVVDRLYKGGPIRGSILQFLPWKSEGNKADLTVFESGGQAATLTTALKCLIKELKQSGIEPSALPQCLSFTLRQFYELCPESRRAVLSRRYENGVPCRFVSTIALKLMILIGVRLWPYLGDDARAFRDELEKVFKCHHKHHKDAYTVTKRQLMTADRFFKESEFFGAETFNSGAKNSDVILRQFRAVLDEVAGS